MEHFGQHFTLDGYGGSLEKLENPDILLDCLNDLPALLNMKQLAPPVVYDAPGNELKDPGGYSGFVVIEESHISIHTFPRRGFVSVDVYTCMNGLVESALSDFFVEKYGLQDTECHMLNRGTRYPAADIY